jgi:ribosomal protein S18 acetylase RimI-like enzyme
MTTMVVPAVLDIRTAKDKDRSRLANLLHFETYVHRHLDWRRPLDWLGQEPYLLAESGGRLVGALACPPDPPGVAWLRFFASSSPAVTWETWDSLWGAAREMLTEEKLAEHAVAIPLQDWFRDLIAKSQFDHTHNVVVLDWRPAATHTSLKKKMESIQVRPMLVADLEAVHAVDSAAFMPLWRHSLDTVQLAFGQSALASVVETDGKVLAYQISTPSSQGLHLARLATHPDQQGHGLAKALILHVQQQIAQRPHQRLTVNTQDNNLPSLGLYQKMAFQLTGETFPVYQLELN